MIIAIQYDKTLSNHVNELCQLAQSLIDGGNEVHFFSIAYKDTEAEEAFLTMQSMLFPHTSLTIALLNPYEDEIEITTKLLQDKNVNIAFVLDEKIANRLLSKAILVGKFYV